MSNKVMQELSELHKKILAHIENHPKDSQAAIGRAVGVDSRALISYHLKELILKRRLKKINHWKVLGDGK